jgi:pimeloyl-ACP methyl ester carboxylesterase
MQNWIDIFFSARDGLRLYGRHYACPGATRRPVVCLAGLTRNSRDFHSLAAALMSDRDVYTLDSRGRGLSEHDSNWKNYTVLVEVNDALDFMAMKGLHNAAIIGTSRGGLLAMTMAVLRPGTVGTVVLNDIGPVLEREGLARITAYVGRVPLPANWTEAAWIAREMNQRFFPSVTDEQWEEFARAWFNEHKGRPARGFDPAIAKGFSPVDAPMPELWPQFDALTPVPVLVVRGENSDLLSVQTVEEMRARHPRLSAITVPGQGHAPLLNDAPTISAIAAFLAQADGERSQFSPRAAGRAALA